MIKEIDFVLVAPIYDILIACKVARLEVEKEISNNRIGVDAAITTKLLLAFQVVHLGNSHTIMIP